MAFFVGDKEDALFRTDAFDFVIFDDKFLFEDFDSVELFGGLSFGKHDFAEIAFTENGEEVEVIEADAAACALGVCWWCGPSLFRNGLRYGSEWTRRRLLMLELLLLWRRRGRWRLHLRNRRGGLLVRHFRWGRRWLLYLNRWLLILSLAILRRWLGIGELCVR